jgi:hypothetical protein
VIPLSPSLAVLPDLHCPTRALLYPKITTIYVLPSLLPFLLPTIDRPFAAAALQKEIEERERRKQADADFVKKMLEEEERKKEVPPTSRSSMEDFHQLLPSVMFSCL